MLLVVLVAGLFHACLCSQADEVSNLPGLTDTINFKQYSGYLNATNGRFLHYWFVESQGDPSTDPVLLWMNGGPGCSSLDGFLSELGPFHINEDGQTLYLNPYSWNKIANVLFLEAPAGVGFSYSLNEEYAADDDSTSMDNYLALQHFFQKFPNFKNNDFYISGESYAGIYIPTLSVRFLEGSSGINFKGFAIGNGYLDVAKLSNSILFFAYYHGLVGQKAWDNVVENCCGGIATRTHCDFSSNNVTSACKKGVYSIVDVVQSSGLNIYNLYSDCAQSSLQNGGYTRDQTDLRTLLKSFSFHNGEIGDNPPCIDGSNITNYLNQNSVRQALHIPSNVQQWALCSPEVEAGYRRLYDTMRPQILELIGSRRLRGLIYNGDVDMACNFLGDEWFFEDLGYPVQREYKLWRYNNQVAGFSKTFGNLTYTTIRGSGHMVPQDKPGPALKMISKFLKNQPF